MKKKSNTYCIIIDEVYEVEHKKNELKDIFSTQPGRLFLASIGQFEPINPLFPEQIRDQQQELLLKTPCWAYTLYVRHSLRFVRSENGTMMFFRYDYIQIF